MKKILGKLIICGLVSVFLVTTSMVSSVEAASKGWKSVCKDYKSFLESNESKFVVHEADFETQNSENYKKASAYLIADLNTDGVPELITYHDDAYKMGRLYVFQDKNGKVKRAKTKEMYGEYSNSIDVSCNAAGRYSIYKDKKGYLHADWSYGDGYNKTTYKLKNNKVTEYLNHTKDTLAGIEIYRIDGNQVSKTEYQSKYKKLKKAGNMLQNNAEGRKDL